MLNPPRFVKAIAARRAAPIRRRVRPPHVSFNLHFRNRCVKPPALFTPVGTTTGRMADAVERLRRAALLSLIAVLTGCAGEGSDDAGNGDGNGNGPCVPPDTPSVTLSEEVQPIYTQRCAYAGCHIAPIPAEGLDLSAGVSYDATVNVPSSQQPDLDLVEPGSPDRSYLWQKIMPPPGSSLVQMPLGCPGIPPNGGCLTAMESAAIEQWILECAADN